MDKKLFTKLAKEEQDFFSTEFLSPVLQRQPIRIKIAGIVLNLKVQPDSFEGWGIFESADQKTARFLREPTMIQKQRYLDLYPRFSFIVCNQGKRVFGIPAHQFDSRIQIQGRVPILLTQEVRLFDCIDVRWDGQNFWYDKPTSGRSVKFATELRDALAQELEAEKLEISGITSEERMAYQLAFIESIELRRDQKEERLKKAIERGGAEFISYVERGNTYTVEYFVNGARHRSVVDSDTLRVTSAGICLSGRDRDFDLQSLIGVVKQGEERGLIYRVGGNYEN
jgi:hypothetical protein